MHQLGLAIPLRSDCPGYLQSYLSEENDLAEQCYMCGEAPTSRDHVVRTVTENSRVLKFVNMGFEKE